MPSGRMIFERLAGSSPPIADEQFFGANNAPEVTACVGGHFFAKHMYLIDAAVGAALLVSLFNEVLVSRRETEWLPTSICQLKASRLIADAEPSCPHWTADWLS